VEGSRAGKLLIRERSTAATLFEPTPSEKNLGGVSTSLENQSMLTDGRQLENRPAETPDVRANTGNATTNQSGSRRVALMAER